MIYLKYGVVGLLFIIVIVTKLYFQEELPAKKIAEITCERLDESCLFKSEKVSYRLTADKQVEGMKVFTLKLEKLDDSNYEPVKVSYSVTNMNMGISEFDFSKKGDKTWESDSMLSFCSLGKMFWVATIYLENEDDDRMSTIDVNFDVGTTH
jgi:hypothetical protein